MIGSKMRAAVCVAALAYGTQALAERGFTAEFASGTTRPQSIALLPVEANVTRARVVETEGLIDESIEYGELFAFQVETLLSDKGYSVKVIDAARINSDPVLQEYVIDAKRAYDAMIAQYRPKRLEKRIYNAGDSAKLLAAHLGVDAIAFPAIRMTITPAGKAIVSALIGGQTAGAFSTVSLVDGGTGDLEVVQNGFTYVTPGDKTDAEMQTYVSLLAANNMKRMPGPDPSARIDDTDASDEQVLDEAEALLDQ
jgi:hypothetical protein